MQRLSVEVTDCRLGVLYRPGSKKTAVVLIHGNSSAKEIFCRQFGTLAAHGYPIVAIDLPGHGVSADAASPRDVYSFPGYARCIIGVLDAIAIGACHLVGWSLGGHIALELLATCSRVCSALITGTAPIALTKEGVSRGFLESEAMRLTGASVLSPYEIGVYGRAMLGEEAPPTSWHARMIARTDGAARHWMVTNGLSGVGVDQIEIVRTCHKPLAVIQGLQDPFVNAQYLDQIDYANVWGGRPRWVQSSHAPHWRSPTLFNDLLIRFLAGVKAA